MKRRELLLTLLFVSTAAISAITGCAKQSNISGASIAKKTLTMVTSPDYPPYEFYNTASSEQKIVGFDIDIANYITKELGYELRILETDFNGLIPALQSQRADFAMAGMTPTEERKKNVDFSTIYYEAKSTIIALKGSNLKTITDLAGKRVGVQLGSLQEENAKKIANRVKDIQLEQLNNVPEIIQEIKVRRIDAAIIEDTVAEGFTTTNPDLEFTVIPVKGPSGSAVAFPQGSTLVEPFNKVLQKMKESGELTVLAKKWFSQSTRGK